MKNIILIFSLIIFFSCNGSIKKDYFEVIKGQRTLFEKNNDKIYHKISLKGNEDLLLYPINVSNYNEEEKLQMIKELLTFKDDSRICSHPVTNYNPNLSQIYRGDKKDYSIQLEALFLINQIFFDSPFNYSSMPILINNKTKIEETIKGKTIAKAYKAYEKWFYKIEKNGIKNALENKEYPLSESGVSWIYSIE